MKLILLAALAALGPAVRAADAPAQTPAEATLPPNAVVLFDGKDAKAWVQAGTQKPCPWAVGNGYMEVKGGSIATTQTYKDCQLHLEFWLPKLPDDVKGEKRANSGVLLQGRYEIQILDSLSIDPLGATDCAALYGLKAPNQTAAAAPETWQTYDVIFRAPRFDRAGKLVKKARVTLFWNSVMVQNDVEVAGPTRGLKPGDVKAPGPLVLQDGGSPVRFRNIWIVPLKSE